MAILFTGVNGFAQKTDSARSVSKFIPTGVQVGYDLMSLARTRYVSTFSGYELSIDADVYRYYPTVEIGNWARDYSSENGSTYENSGSFWRAGIDVNFMKKDPEKNMFFLGARYGRSAYSEKARIITTDKLWGDLDQTYENTSVVANWLELTTGMRIRVWKIFWLGYTARFKFALNKDEGATLLPTDVPGYGATERPTTWGFSYYALVKFPVRRVR
jgi:hypothetical protein